MIATWERITLFVLIIIAALGIIASAFGQEAFPPSCTVVDAHNVICKIDMGIMAPGTTKSVVIVTVNASGVERTETVNVTQSTIKSSAFDGKTLNVEMQNPQGISSLKYELKE